MPNTFQPHALPTLIGSLPHKDPATAVQLIEKYVPAIPIWPQLPFYKQEGMVSQYAPGMPGLMALDDTLFVDATTAQFDTELVAFYEDYLAIEAGTLELENSRFGLTPEIARGFYAFAEHIDRRDEPPAAVKGHVTGPITFCTGLKDQDGRAIFYNDQLRDAGVKLLALKASWQVRRLKQGQSPVIVFIDEPALAGFGTSEMISIAKEDVSVCLQEIIAAVHAEGGLTGIHVCANTDWGMILESGVDIVNFDAYAYFDRFLLFPEQIKAFVDAGHLIAWGLIPTLNAEVIEKESVSTLVAAWHAKVAQLAELGLDKTQIQAQSLITPSCGVGSLSETLAVRVLELTRDVSAQIRQQG